jgi:hypothetical protein
MPHREVARRAAGSRLKVLVRLPRLAWRAARWQALRGGWLPRYLLRHRPFDHRSLPPGTPVDVLVIMTDHFEPSDRDGPDAATEAVASWCTRYERLVRDYRDSDGRTPQHTWFYRAEYPNPGCLAALAAAAFRGLGEVEFHLHHGFDTHASFAAKLRTGLDFFNGFGAMLTAEARPRPRFAYVAGNWALDNGAGDDAVSGCNTELLALHEAGCYADFTFPALGSRAQPRKVNALYYATDGPEPKSYDNGTDLACGGRPEGHLLIFQGPLVVDWQAGRFEDGALEPWMPASPDRLGAWLRAHVHVRGRPEWVFVKLHTHGMQSRDHFLGPAVEGLLRAMTERWTRDGYRLHFVTAREAYNIARAAEAGHAGDPNKYRDFDVPPPANRRLWCSAPWRLLGWEPGHVGLEVHGGGTIQIRFAGLPLRGARGSIRRLRAGFADGRLADLQVKADGPVETDPPYPAAPARPSGAGCSTSPPLV